MNIFKKALLLFLIMIPTGSVHSADGVVEDEGILNKLLAPGKLITGHIKQESDCLSCHSAGKGVPSSKCFECHKDISAQVTQKHGFHGLNTKTCIQCHSDHKGRDYDSVAIDEKTFDHKLTGYILEGKHAQIKCIECHVEKRSKAKKDLRPNDTRYFGLKTSCKQCHIKDDVHFFTSDKWKQKDCAECHGLKTWKTEIKFEHTRDTGFKLEGKHKDLKCATCHLPNKIPPAQYQWANLKKSDCLACHKDQHIGKLSKEFQGGKQCTTCHDQTSWKIPKFDHEVTDYALKGKHFELNCIDCHKQGNAAPNIKLKDFNFTGLKKDCLSCHKDFHLFDHYVSKKLGKTDQCLSCHNETKWKQVHDFNHNVHTRFEIAGKHLGLECNKCHIQSSPLKRTYFWPSLPQKDCELCHKNVHKDNPSKAFKEKKCSECHTDQAWKIFKKGDKSFNHDKNTQFKLTGKHKGITCNGCHLINKIQVYKFENAEKGFCISCHKNQHIGQFKEPFLSQRCDTCHNTDNWTQRSKFDHDTTEFKLTGKHTPLKCEKCHNPTRDLFESRTPHFKNKYLFKKTDPQSCVECHKNVHADQFHSKFSDKSCASCHTTQDFKKRLVFNHDETSFKLKGKHIDVQCLKCHTKTDSWLTEKPPVKASKFIFNDLQTSNCKSCHKDVHQGKFGSKCADCHTEQTWKKTSDFHKNFKLSGVHYSLECAECHRDQRHLTGMSENCKMCHQKDDIHHGTLPNCGDCHRQQFWENTDFKHSLTSFPLRGIHRTLDCYACHQNGIYHGTPSRCVDCHRSDALNYAGLPNHSTLLNQSCFDCHNQFSFH